MRKRVALIALSLLTCALIFTPHIWASCSAPGNAIEAENCLTGTPQSTWDINWSAWEGSGSPPSAGDSSIQGFADDISVNVGQTINFKIDTPASAYTIPIYRLGYYQGNGARLVTTLTPSAKLPQSQPACKTNASVGLYDCGNWGISASWTVPTTAVSGIYVARPTRSDTGGASHIVFIVRNDAGTSNILFQASDTTYQAYNDSTNGQNLYTTDSCGWWEPQCRAYKVSYNRPFTTRVFEFADWLFNGEYPMIRWLEANGYDVSYTTNTDTDRNGSLILKHKVFMSNGHDEYWSAAMRTNVLAARDAGVHLAWFSGNTMFWKVRWENSIDGSNTPYRTLVCYKETYGDVTDPDDPPTWTGTWRDPTKSPPADGGQPENAVKGSLFRMNSANLAVTVPLAYSKFRLWRNTSVAKITSGSATLAPGTVGAEFDDDEDNGFRPAGQFQLSSISDTDSSNYLLDYGVTYGAGTAISSTTMYKAPSGALVFSTGSYQWSWGLDNHHDGTNLGDATNTAMQQATVNLLADMGVQPVTIQSGLTLATASTDTTPPTSVITSPTAGATITPGNQVTIKGTATDVGGVVAGVEVSVDNGNTWHPATGQGSWTYTWMASGNQTTTIRSRAVDDSGNLETPSAGVSVTVGSGTQTCPCTIFGNLTPGTADAGSDSPVELGVRFQSSVAGTVSGIRFYKSAANTGTHIGNLWSNTGTNLASATFTNETASGWQTVNFTSPIAISANTYYMASYHSTIGHYSEDDNFFTTTYSNSPLLAPQDGVAGADGAYTYGSSSAFPTSDWEAANYWVDLVFTPASTTAGLSSVAVNPTSVTGGASSTGTVTLTAPAPSSGITVTIGSNSSSAVPSVSSLTIPSGSSSGTFTVNTTAVATTTTATITATYNSTSVQTTLTITPVANLTAVSVNPTSVAGGNSSTGTVTLNNPAPTGGATVSLSSGSTSATVPASVTVAAGSTTATFTATTTAVSTSTPVTITASYNSVNVQTTLTVNPPALSAVSMNPTSVVGGSSSTGTVTLTGPAPTGGISVALQSNNSAATVPANVTVAANATSATFTATTVTVTTSTPVTITATYAGVNQTTTLTVTPKSALAIDKNVSTDRSTKSTTITSPTFTTSSANELLLAFVMADNSGSGANTTVTGITGGSLTWTLVRRTNAQYGTAEVWRAFAPAVLTSASVKATLSVSVAASLTVVTFTGASTSGTGGSGAIGATASANASTGAPSASLTTTQANSWVFGVGNDWDNAIARTVPSGETLVHQYLSTTGDTYWVQSTTAATPVAGTLVTINDTAPTTDRYNLTLVEVLP